MAQKILSNAERKKSFAQSMQKIQGGEGKEDLVPPISDDLCEEDRAMVELIFRLGKSFGPVTLVFESGSGKLIVNQP